MDSLKCPKLVQRSDYTLSVFAYGCGAQKVHLTTEAAVNRFAERIRSNLALQIDLQSK